MPDVALGGGMFLRFEDDAVMSCSGDPSHVVGHLGERVVGSAKKPAFIFEQPHPKLQPIYAHVCTVCGSSVPWPNVQANSF
jgi:hypothetical protein